MMKKLIGKTLSKFGLELRKINKEGFNLPLYNKYYPVESIENKRFYNVGAGGFYHPYWTNIDYLSDWYKDNNKLTEKGIHYDLFSLDPISVKDETGEIIYSSHTIEHIKDEHAQHFFNEAFRILKKGGVIRITAPDIDLHYQAFKNDDYDFYYWRSWYSKASDYKRIMLNQSLTTASIAQLFLQRFAGAASVLHDDGVKERITDEELIRIFSEMKYEDALSYCCERCTIDIQKKYPGNHTNWWNRAKAIKMLRNSGFKNIVVSGYGQSRSPAMRNTAIFDSTHPKISLYVEAIK